MEITDNCKHKNRQKITMPNPKDFENIIFWFCNDCHRCFNCDPVELSELEEAVPKTMSQDEKRIQDTLAVIKAFLRGEYPVAEMLGGSSWRAYSFGRELTLESSAVHLRFTPSKPEPEPATPWTQEDALAVGPAYYRLKESQFHAIIVERVEAYGLWLRIDIGHTKYFTWVDLASSAEYWDVATKTWKPCVKEVG